MMQFLHYDAVTKLKNIPAGSDVTTIISALRRVDEKIVNEVDLRVVAREFCRKAQVNQLRAVYQNSRNAMILMTGFFGTKRNNEMTKTR